MDVAESGLKRFLPLGDEILYHVAMDVGQSIVTPLEMIGQLLVIQAQQMQNGSLQIVNMHRVLDDGKTEFVGLAVGESPLDPTPGHPYGETVGVVVAPQHIAIGSSTFAE